MFDWLRKATQSAEISRQERVLDYVDETLSAEARKRFEAELSADADLQREVAELRTVKAALNALPRQPVPRNFTLDPAKYSKPARAWDAQFYPAMRMATALTAIMFLIVASLTFLPFNAGNEFATGLAPAPVALESADFAEENAAEVAMVEEVNPEMAEAQQMGEADSAEFDSAANSARLADDVMDESAADSAEMTEMVEMESGDIADEVAAEVAIEPLSTATAMPEPTLGPEVASEAMGDGDASAAESSAMVEEPASDASSAAASSGAAPAVEPQFATTATPVPTPTAAPALASEAMSDDSAATSEPQPTPTAMPTRTLVPMRTLAPEVATEVFKAAPPLEEEVPEEAVAEAISAEPASDTAGVATDASDTIEPPSADNAESADQATSGDQSSSIRPIVLWAFALLALFLLLLFLTLRTRARL